MSRKFLTLVVALSFVLAHCALAETRVANDPSRIGVGARLLGMGKGYVGLADELYGIFIDPASLASVTRPQYTSMSGKFINEFNYLNLGAAYPTPFGTFGLGYVGSSIGFLGISGTTEVVDGVRIIPSTTEGNSYDFNNAVMLISWGQEMSKILPWDLFKDFSAGASIKFFSLSMSGAGISDGSGSGNELDIGLKYDPKRIFKAGLVVQNALPFAMGGKIKWSDSEESLPSTVKAGVSLRLLGQEGWGKLGEQELTLNVDRDFFPGRDNLPQLWHMGMEWTPLELLTLRVGIDQDIIGTGGAGKIEPADNFTAGIGLSYWDFRFDYAYHQYYQVAENDTHYFSLSYGVTKEKKRPEVKIDPFSLRPEDKTLLFADSVTVEGGIMNERITRVTINNSETPVKDYKFAFQQPLALRKNAILVQGYDSGKKMIGEKKIRILRLQSFKDVPADHWAAIPVSFLAMENVITGYPDGTFRPEGNITRAELCTLLMKSQETSTKSQTLPKFIDVVLRHWAVGYIAQAAQENVVKGYPDGTFRPEGNITRAEGVAVIARFAKIPEARAGEPPFPDVPGRHWAEKEISAAKEGGLLKYLEGRSFEPNKPLTRAEVAEMLTKSILFSSKLKRLLDWESGY